MDPDICIECVLGRTSALADHMRRMHATLFLDWVLDVRQYEDWRVADQKAADESAAHVATSNRDAAQIKAQLQHTDATNWHHARNTAKKEQFTHGESLIADVAHAQTGQLGSSAAPEQVVRRVGVIEAEMRKAHIFISGNDPHDVEIERLGMTDDEEVSGAHDVKHVWQVFMEHKRRHENRRS